MMRFVCPQCKGQLDHGENVYACGACARSYPVICGIPDFRLAPDPYIGIEADCAKGRHLDEQATRMTFAELVRYYYSITPEVPPDHAERWTAHSLAQTKIAAEMMASCGLPADCRALLDVGCSTGGLLGAANTGLRVGVDVAFRWLVAGKRRLAELGIEAELVCANAEHLPFEDNLFDLVTAVDVLEHVRDAGAAISESRRVLTRGGRIMCATNNRFAPLPDPQVGVWAVGYVPRRWQAAYVARVRRGLHRYEVRMTSAAELKRLFRQAGFKDVRTDPAPLIAPHVEAFVLKNLLRVYNRARTMAPAKPPLKLLGPRLVTLAER